MYQEINDFIQRYGDDIYRFCYYLTKNRTEAEDLYQEAFLKAVEKKEVLLHILQAVRQEKEDRSALKYLMAIVANLWRNKQRKQMRHRRIAPRDDREEAVLAVTSHVGNPERDYLQKELREEVRRVVYGLPDKMKVVVYLYYIVQMSTAEIAEELHIPNATVRSRLSRLWQWVTDIPCILSCVLRGIKKLFLRIIQAFPIVFLEVKKKARILQKRIRIICWQPKET